MVPSRGQTQRNTIVELAWHEILLVNVNREEGRFEGQQLTRMRQSRRILPRERGIRQVNFVQPGMKPGSLRLVAEPSTLLGCDALG